MSRKHRVRERNANAQCFSDSFHNSITWTMYMYASAKCIQLNCLTSVRSPDWNWKSFSLFDWFMSKICQMSETTRHSVPLLSAQLRRIQTQLFFSFFFFYLSDWVIRCHPAFRSFHFNFWYDDDIRCWIRAATGCGACDTNLIFILIFQLHNWHAATVQHIWDCSIGGRLKSTMALLPLIQRHPIESCVNPAVIECSTVRLINILHRACPLFIFTRIPIVRLHRICCANNYTYSRTNVYPTQPTRDYIYCSINDFSMRKVHTINSRYQYLICWQEM